MGLPALRHEAPVRATRPRLALVDGARVHRAAHGFAVEGMPLGALS